MKTYLVTGGCGFIGSNYIHYMLRESKDILIVNVDSLTYAGNPENLSAVEALPGYRFVRADVCDGEAMDELFRQYDVDCVVHFAAESHVDRSIKNPEVFVRTNVLGTLTLLNAAKKSWEIEGGFKAGKKYVQVSTDEVYGSLGETGYFTEDTSLDPHSPYSASKAGADLLVKSYYDTYGMPVNITRCSNNYGPFQFPEKFIPLLVNNVLQGKDLPVFGDGKNVRDWLYVDDHARAIDMVTRNGVCGQVYNIGGNNERTNIDIVHTVIDTVAELLPQGDPRRAHVSRDLIKYVTDRKGHDRRYAIDASKIRRELGFKPEVDFAEGIRGTIKWYLDNPGWVERVTSGEYQSYYEDMYRGR